VKIMRLTGSLLRENQHHDLLPYLAFCPLFLREIGAAGKKI